MESLTIDEQLAKIVTSCKWAEVVDGLRMARIKRYLLRAVYSTITILRIDLKRSMDGDYLIKAEGSYHVIELEDWERCIREIAFVTGLENYAISREIIEFVLDKMYERKEVVN